MFGRLDAGHALERRRPHTFRTPLSAGYSRRGQVAHPARWTRLCDPLARASGLGRGQAPTHNRRPWRRLSLRQRSASCLRFLRGSPCVVLTVWAPCSSTGYSWTLCPAALLRNPAAPDCATRPCRMAARLRLAGTARRTGRSHWLTPSFP